MTSNPYSSVECRLEPILVLVISYTGGPGKNLSQTVGVVPSLSQATSSVFRYRVKTRHLLCPSNARTCIGTSFLSLVNLFSSHVGRVYLAAGGLSNLRVVHSQSVLGKRSTIAE